MPTEAQIDFEEKERLPVLGFIRDCADHTGIRLVWPPIWNDGLGKLPSDSDKRVVWLQSGKGHISFHYYKWELDTPDSRAALEQRIQEALKGL